MRIRKVGSQEDCNRVVLNLMKEVHKTQPDCIAIVTEWVISSGFTDDTVFQPWQSDRFSIVICPLVELIEEIEYYELVFEWFVASITLEPVLLSKLNDVTSLPGADGNRQIWLSKGEPRIARAIVELAVMDFDNISVTCRADLDEYLTHWSSQVDMSMLKDDQAMLEYEASQSTQT